MSRFSAILHLFCVMASFVSADLPNPFILQRADPWIYRHDDGSYFFTASVPSFDRIELRRSNTLEGLIGADPVTVWRKNDNGPMSYHIWAPELHFIEGKWYLYFAAGRADAIWNIRMYVLENNSADPLQGEWIEKGQIETPWDSFSLDATTFEHGGQRYLVWAQKDRGSGDNSALWIAKLENPWTLGSPPIKLSEPEFEWERRLFAVNEGPAFIARNDRVFLTYSASGTNHHYCMGLLSAEAGADLLDPRSWSKSAVPVFESSSRHGIYGPGHNSFTTDDEGLDYLVYHARNYKEIAGDPLDDGNRHTRLQPFTWNDEGFPEFGEPRSETEGNLVPSPLFRDPIHDGAADPVVIWNPERGRWWMFYTNRRANLAELSGVAWVHGTRIGIAESSDGGAHWYYVGEAEITLPHDVGGDEPTHWAPDVVADGNGGFHMFLTVVPGVFENWNHPRSIVHLVSDNLRTWKYLDTLDLASDRVIDASLWPLPDGSWRMWYNDERTGKSIWFADSPDLFEWTNGSQVIADRPGEGPKVFFWKGFYWMITDVWSGLGVYRSHDAAHWERKPGENLLVTPGTGTDDATYGHHADVVVQGERAFLFYFTHPEREVDGGSGGDERRSSLQAAELHLHDGWLTVDRDAPLQLFLDPGLSPKLVP
jgi:GH43 family beta-xylosidase